MKKIFSLLITLIAFLSVSANDSKIQVKSGHDVGHDNVKVEVVVLVESSL